MSGIRGKSELFASLPPAWAKDMLPQIRATVAAAPHRKLVVLDDDPTGTQTVYDVPVLTVWDVPSLSRELSSQGACFYILTNSRAFPAGEACRLNREICQNLTTAAGRFEFVILSRSDSTLRGHFPDEVEAIGRALTAQGNLPPILLVPFFEAGGRFTVNDVHYVAEDDQLVPAAKTPFACDAVFGYRNSNLRRWVEEKTRGRVRAVDVVSLSIHDLRVKGPEAVLGKLVALRDGQICIANAAAARDLEVLAWAVLRAEERGSRMLFRTAASFVAARLGLQPRPLIGGELAKVPSEPITVTGGLTVVGSYVPRTTEQLRQLLGVPGLQPVELSVEELLTSRREEIVAQSARRVSELLAARHDVVVFTSRELVVGQDAETSLGVGSHISGALVDLVQRLRTRPRYLVAKGGVTSSDLATKALGVKRAMVRGQILPGVPVWELGPESKFHGLPYVIFPGNVGGPEALKEVILKLHRASSA